jgi:hypothetical protein
VSRLAPSRSGSGARTKGSRVVNATRTARGEPGVCRPAGALKLLPYCACVIVRSSGVCHPTFALQIERHLGPPSMAKLDGSEVGSVANQSRCSPMDQGSLTLRVIPEMFRSVLFDGDDLWDVSIRHRESHPCADASLGTAARDGAPNSPTEASASAGALRTLRGRTAHTDGEYRWRS